MLFISNAALKPNRRKTASIGFIILIFTLCWGVFKCPARAADNVPSCSLVHKHMASCYEMTISGDTGTKLICPFKSDTTVFSAYITGIPTTWTNSPVTLTANASWHKKLPAPARPFIWSVNVNNNSASQTFTANGQYNLVVDSGSYGAKQIDFEIKYIDMVAPTISKVALSTTAYTASGVTITVTASDSISGLSASAYSFDGGVTYGASNSKTVSENGTYTIVVRDNAGNISSSKVTVSNIDKSGPSIASYKADVTEWTNKNVTLSAQASDGGCGLHTYPFSFDGGNHYSASGEYAVSGNGDYPLIVRDKIGNYSTAQISVKNIDKDNPVIDYVSLNTQEWVKEGVLISLKASDATSGLHETPYSFDGGKTFTADNSFMAQKNGNVKIVVRDKASNTATYTVKISNVDDVIPDISAISKSTTAWTNGKVTINVNALDNESGLCDAPYSFDGGNTYTASSSYDISDSGTYTVCVKDIVGNIARKEVKITNIDKDAPVIETLDTDTTDWTNGKVTVRIKARDDASGLYACAYSWNGDSYDTASTFKVSENGVVSVSVKDNAGNVANKTITVGNIDKSAPKISAIKKSTTAWTNEGVTVSLEASDDESGLSEASYSFDGGKTYSKSSSFTVSQNTDIAIAVKDKAGNVTNSSISVTNIDKKGPVFSSSLDTQSWTNRPVVISVSARDEGAGLASTAYSFNDLPFDASSTFKASGNGNYNVKVRDSAGNISERVVSVTNIDTTAPVISSITKSTEDWIEKELTVTVNATDELSGLNGTCYSYDGGAHYSKSSTATIKANGTYQICVRDVAGNVATSSITIANIGKNPTQLEKERLEAEKEAERKKAAEEKIKKEQEEAARKKEQIEKEKEEAQKQAELKRKEAEEAKRKAKEAKEEKEKYEKELEEIRKAKEKTEEEKKKAQSEEERKRLEEEQAQKEKEMEEKERQLEEAKKQADEYEKKAQTYEKESDSLEEELLNKSKALEESEKEYASYGKRISEYENESRKARENANILSAKVEAENSKGLVNKFKDLVHDESKDIVPLGDEELVEASKLNISYDENGNPIIIGPDGEVIRVSSKGGKSSIASSLGVALKEPKNRVLFAAVVLLIIGTVMALSLSYVYLDDSKKIRRLTFVRIKKDNSKVIVRIGEGKLKEDGRYHIYMSPLKRIIKRQLPAYVSVEGNESIITTENGKVFEWTETV